MIYICNYCGHIGHKVSKCPKRIEIEPYESGKCGLCGCIHPVGEDCNFNFK